MAVCDLPAELRALIAARDAATTKSERKALSKRVKLMRVIISCRKQWGWPLVFEREASE